MKVTIVGSGYVGLVTGACLAEVRGSNPLSSTIQSWQTGRVSGFEETAFRLREMF